MTPRTQRDTLDTLIDICRDAARGFKLAADHAEDPELKRVFQDAARRRGQFAVELLPFAHGPASDVDGSVLGRLHRGWMSLRDTIGGDERSLLDEARRGEAIAARAYADAVTGILPPNARRVIERQYAEIRGVQQDLDAMTLPCA